MAPYILRKGRSSLLDLKDGYLGLGDYAIGAHKVYFVDSNSGANGDGSSFDSPFNTLAQALALSHADIASGSAGWAARNVIYYKGDGNTELLTKLADKTTVVGVGSTDGNGSARIKGVQTIAGTYNGTRFVNMEFIAASDTVIGMTLPTECGGIEFYGCTWLPGGASNTIALRATAVTALKVIGCEFNGWWNVGWDTTCIDIPTGAVHGVIIQGNRFNNQVGSALITAASSTSDGCFFQDNTCVTSAIAIDDVSDNLYVINNTFVVGTTNADNTGTNFNILKAARNVVTGSNGTIDTPNMG